MNKIKTLLLGLGRIGTTLENDPYRYHPCTHAGVLLSPFGKKNFILSGIHDIEEEKVQSFLQQWKLKPEKVPHTPEEIEKTSFDLAIIASTSDSHLELALRCLKNGIKNLLIEKPLVRNLKELQILKKEVQKQNAKIWVNHERRYHFLYRYVKETVLSSKYGELRTVKASVLTSFRDPGHGFDSSGGGPLLHDGTHAIDFIDFLLSESPSKIDSALQYAWQDSKIEERAVATLQFPNQVYVFLEAGGKRNYFQFEIDIELENARFVLSNDGHRFYVSQKSKLYKGFRSLKGIPLPKIPNSKKNPWINLYREISDNLSGKTEEITGSIQANENILKIIESIYRGKRSL